MEKIVQEAEERLEGLRTMFPAVINTGEAITMHFLRKKARAGLLPVKKTTG